MVQKVRKKGYFAKRRGLKIMVLLTVVALSILITAFIIKLVYSQKKKTSKSEQTPKTDNENEKYQNFANEFESNPANKTRDLLGTSYKISVSLGAILNRKLALNNSVLELNSTADKYTYYQEDIDRTGGMTNVLSLGTLLVLWKSMKTLNIGDAKTLTEPEQVNHTIMVEKQLIYDLRNYKIQMTILRGQYRKYEIKYGDQAQNVVLFSHIPHFIKSLEIKFNGITINNQINKQFFNYWESEIGNKLALVFLDKFPNIVLGLPLFMIFNLITELNTREIRNNEELICGQYKPLLEQILNTDTFTKEQIDVVKGKFYKLFILLETQEIKNNVAEDEDENKKIDAVYRLLQLLDDDLKNFLVIYKKIE